MSLSAKEKAAAMRATDFNEWRWGIVKDGKRFY